MRQTTAQLLLRLIVALPCGCVSAAPPAEEATDGGGTGDANGTDATGGTTGAPTSTGSTGEALGCPDVALGPDPALCPGGTVPDSIFLASQADVDRMHGCTRVVDRLDISGPDIVDLCPLTSLVEVGKYLEIRLNPELESLAGLERLERVGAAVFVSENAALRDLEGLVGLRHVYDVSVNINASLISLAGLRNTRPPPNSYAEVFIAANDSLTTLAGIESVVAEDTMRVTLYANPALTDLSALAGADRLGGLSIRDHAQLESLAGIEQLQRVDGTVDISRNPRLADLAGLSGLRTVEGLELTDNPALKDLSGLSGLQTADWVQLGDLAPLSSLAGLGGLTRIGSLVIEASDSLTSLAGLDALTEVGELRVIRCAGLVSLAGLEGAELTAELWLNKNPALASLAGLAAPSSLNRLYLGDNDALASLAKLDPLASIHDLTIINHATLPQADAEAWAAGRLVAGLLKVDGNLGAAPHVDSCPWVEDFECDEDTGTGLCPEGSDEFDCNLSD
ncbi:hypothetical protein [Nannocystis pusilla]|uniref:hypothetical protein n=1 Tax=Nannocystis pusilla TaxID=889268 RepID=UPI003DA1DA87